MAINKEEKKYIQQQQRLRVRDVISITNWRIYSNGK